MDREDLQKRNRTDTYILYIPMKTDLITDNAAAIEFLKACRPKWIDEMPLTTSMRSPSKCNIAQDGFYCEEGRQGVLAHFFGTGCKKGDGGWRLLVVSDATEAEFDANTVAFACLAAFEMGIHPSALISAA